MSAHSSKKRKRTSTADGDGSGVDESSGPDRWTPPPPKPRAAPVAAVQGTPGRAKTHHRKSPGMTGRCHGGQRCCVACGGDGGSGPRARCSMCDGEYHPGCLDPPRAYAPKGGWACGLCSDNNYHDQDRWPFPVGSPITQKLQQQQQQQEMAAGPQSRLADVASSALARLSSLSDGCGGGSRETATAEQRAPGVAGPAAAASPSVGQSREREDAAHMTDSVLAWALKSVGGSGEEGKTTPSQSGYGSTGGGSGPDVYLDAAEGSDARESRPLSSPAAERRGERRKRGVLSRSESGDSLESVGGDDNDGFSPPLWQEETEAQEDAVTSDAFDNDGGGGGGGGGDDHDDVHDFGSRYGDDPTRLGDPKGSGAGSEEAAKARQERESTRSGSDVSKSNAGVATSDSVPAREGGSGSGTFAVTNGDAESSAAVVAPGSDSEEDGEGARRRKRRSLWDKDENTRFLQGVTKYGDAWARLAQRHQDTGVVVVDESDGDDDEEDAGDDFGGGEPCADDGEVCASAPPAGGETNEKRQNKKQDKGKKLGVCPSRQRRGLKWDEDEHQRFVEGFGRHGSSWAEVARVVCTRSEEQVARYALRWVDDKGRVRNKTNVNKTGRWDDDEHERFVEGTRKFGRSFEDVAIVVGTRSGDQCKKHARAARARGHLSRSVSKTQDARKKPWGKEEHERFLEAIARHGRSWSAVVQAVGTRDKTQVCNHAARVFNKDLSPKTPSPMPASPAKRSSGARAEDVVPPRTTATATATAAAVAAAAALAAVAAAAAATATSARAAPTPKSARPPRSQAAAATAAKPNPRAAAAAAAAAAPVAQGGGGGGADAADAGGPVNTGKEPSSVAVVENDSGDEKGDGDGDGDGLGAPAAVGGEANKGRDKPEKMKHKKQDAGEESLGRTRLQRDLKWDWREHKRFVQGFEEHGSSWVEVARAVRTRSEEQVARYALRWVDHDGRVRRKTTFRNSGRWNDGEHERFLEGVKMFGRAFRDVAIVVGTRSLEQVKKHARAEQVKQVVSRTAKSSRWDKEENERFLEAVAKHGSEWVAVAQAVGTRDKTQVCNHAVRVLNKDVSPKTAAPTPTIPAKRSGQWWCERGQGPRGRERGRVVICSERIGEQG